MKGYAVQFANDEIHIYAYVTPTDEVLYIGRTYDPVTRNGAHRQRSSWWTPDLTFALIDTVLGWEAGKRHEAQAIRHFRPTFNVIHNQGVAA